MQLVSSVLYGPCFRGRQLVQITRNLGRQNVRMFRYIKGWVNKRIRDDIPRSVQRINRIIKDSVRQIQIAVSDIFGPDIILSIGKDDQ